MTTWWERNMQGKGRREQEELEELWEDGIGTPRGWNPGTSFKAVQKDKDRKLYVTPLEEDPKFRDDGDYG